MPDGTLTELRGRWPRVAALAQPLLRVGWSVADQALVSLTNAGLSLLVAASVDSSVFGAFAVAFNLYAFLLGTSRALTGQALPVRFSGAQPQAFRAAARSCLAAAAAFGAAVGVALVGVGVALGGSTGGALVAIGFAMPGLLLQDAWRAVFFADGRPGGAAALDAGWTVLQFSAVGMLLAGGVHSATPVVACWGATATVAALGACVATRTLPDLRAAPRWIWTHWDLSRYYVVEWVFVLGAMQVTILLIGMVGSVADVGSLRAVQVLQGPLYILTSGILAFAVPELSRRRALTPRELHGAALLLSALTIGLATVWGLALLLLPGELGVRLLGDTWAGARSVLPGMVLASVLINLQTGPLIVLRCLGAARASLGVNALYAPLLFGCGVGGLLLAGATGAAYGLALACLLVGPVWWLQLGRAVANAVARPQEGPDVALRVRVGI